MVKKTKIKENKLKTEDNIYMEEGTDLTDFEKNINAALRELSVSREIQQIEFKTGIQENHPLGGTNWYSMAIHHQPKTSYELEILLKRMEEVETSNKKYEIELAKNLKRYLNSATKFQHYLKSAKNFENFFKLFTALETTYTEVFLKEKLEE